MSDEEIRRLHLENARLQKINQVLMDRVERSMDLQGDAFSLFQMAVQLEDRVHARTQELEQALSQLQATRNLLSEAIESIDEGFALYDADDRFVLCNSRLRWIMQFNPGPEHCFTDVLNHMVERKLLPEAEANPQEWIEQRLSQHRNPGSPLVIRLGTDRWLRVSERRIANGGIVSLYTDITEIKQLEERRRQQDLAENSALLQATLDNLEQGVALVDSDNRLRIWNPRFVDLLHVADRGLYPGYYFHHLPGFDDLFPVQEATRYEVQIDHRRRIADLLRTPLPSGDQVVTLSDVTERRLREVQVHRAVQHLTQANTELDRFAYVASHDLREPLRTIVSFSQLLQRKGKFEGDMREYLDLIIGAGNRMNDLIGGLLHYSRLSGHTQPFQPCDLDLVCQMACDNLRSTILSSQAKLKVFPLPIVMADPVQMGQLFQNLIGNALKYRRPDQPPAIRISAQQEDSQWVISIEDNGIGIEETGHDIYEIFRRLHSAGSSYPGTGIGLAICRRIMQNHGGRLWHQPAPQQGTIFRFSFDAAQPIL